jgi:hypothetical protein
MAFFFPDDVFKQIISYTKSLPKCQEGTYGFSCLTRRTPCPCVATEKCLNCKDDCCKAHISTENASQGICADCVRGGYVFCDLCPGEYTNMECENCAQMFCGECRGRDEDGLIYDGLCCECAPAEEDEDDDE